MKKVYENYKIYGPYQREDGRKHIIAISKKGIRYTVSYPKYLMEIKLNRYLTNEETVHHVDNNFNNNDINNLIIIKRSKHVSQDVKKVQPVNFICEVCEKNFTLSGKKLHDANQNRKKGKRGPFCSRGCAGKASHNINKYENKKIKTILK